MTKIYNFKNFKQENIFGWPLYYFQRVLVLTKLQNPPHALNSLQLKDSLIKSDTMMGFLQALKWGCRFQCSIANSANRGLRIRDSKSLDVLKFINEFTVERYIKYDFSSQRISFSAKHRQLLGDWHVNRQDAPNCAEIFK
jgi:hypothetical protein